MATTGPALYPGAATFPGSTTYPGGGDLPSIEVLYTTDDATDPTPSWVYAHTDLREYQVGRGRSTELEEIDAATATIVLDNRARIYDPNANALLGPMNRWWIRTKFAGETQDRFKGYADRYALSWPEKGKDSVVSVSCSDEFKVLNLANMPTTSPPRDTYQDLVLVANPAGYWPCDDQAGTNQIAAVAGDPLVPVLAGAVTNYTAGPIVGQTSETGYYAVSVSQSALANGGYSSAAENPIGDVAGLSAFTVGCWVYINAVAGVEESFIFGPDDSGSNGKWALYLTTTGAVKGWARNSGGTTFTVTSAPLSGFVWHYVVWALVGGTFTLYVDGVSQGTTAMAGSFDGTLDSTSTSAMGVTDVTGATVRLSQIVFYRSGFVQSDVTALYTAGVSRGFPAQLANLRADAALDVVSSNAPRSLRTAQRSVVQRYMHGQSCLDVLKDAEQAEQVTDMLFIGRDGTVTFLDAAHRSTSPWNTVQIVFDDDGTDSSYWDTEQDLSEAFLFNEWNVTMEAFGNLQTVSDTASIARYRKRSRSLTVPVVSDVDANNIAVASLAAYKDPMPRVPSVAPNMANMDVAVLALRRELADKIQVIRRPLGGGSAITQTAWIQSISEQGTPGEPLRVTFGVSPR